MPEQNGGHAFSKASNPLGYSVRKLSSRSNSSLYKSVVIGGDDPLPKSPRRRRDPARVKRLKPARSRSNKSSRTLFPPNPKMTRTIITKPIVTNVQLRQKAVVRGEAPETAVSTDGISNQSANQAVTVTVKTVVENDLTSSPQIKLVDPNNLSQWGLPTRITKAYEKVGLTSMFPWQSECLNCGDVLNGRNLVYSAPTSAGKTLVAEILLLKRVLETQKKGLFILPFVALAREKMINLQRLFKGTGVTIGGFMGHQHPPGGMTKLNIAVCTIEKANSLVNRMVAEKTLSQLSIIVVDELHMVGDFGRGYLLELLLTKIQYFNKVHIPSQDNADERHSIQVVGMSATLPNLSLLAKWLDAQLYTTDYRPVPLYEHVKLGLSICDKSWKKLRDVPALVHLQKDPEQAKKDPDHVVSLCYETVRAGHGVLVFCPFKNWCESMAEIVASQFSDLRNRGLFDSHALVDQAACDEILAALRATPTGLDSILGRTVPLGVAFHHAGLTMDEREIVEAGFRKYTLRVLVATTTLASGVNLPARRVIIRSPMFMNSIMDVLTYYQMAGRAGRKGVDTEGESILICKDVEKSKVTSQLFGAALTPIRSCLTPGSGDKVSSTMLRAVLEVIANGSATTLKAIVDYMDCTLFSAGNTALSGGLSQTIVDTLKSKDLICVSPETNTLNSTQLGNAMVWSGLSPGEGFSVFHELEKARLHVNLETELHIIYLVTPYHLITHVSSLDWYRYMMLWERLPPAWKRVASLVGVRELDLAMALRGRTPPESTVACLQRFYCALILNELVHEVPMNIVASKYQVNKGLLQTLQQGGSTYSGIVAIFCQELGWENMGMLVEQFQSRLMFGVQRELMELIRIDYLSARQARLLYRGGYPNLAKLATAETAAIKDILIQASPFNSRNPNEKSHGILPGQIYLNGMEAMMADDAAVMVIAEARRLLASDMEILGFRLTQTDGQPMAPPVEKRHDEDTMSEAAPGNPPSLSTQDNDKRSVTSQNVAEFSEIRSTQLDGEEPLDPALQAADDILRTSQAGEEACQKSVATAVAGGGMSSPARESNTGFMASPDRIESSDTEQDVDNLNPPSSACSSQYVPSTYASEQEFFSSSFPMLPTKTVLRSAGRTSYPSTSDADFEAYAANYQTYTALALPGRRNADSNFGKTPLTLRGKLDWDHVSGSPDLFATPESSRKRKLFPDSAAEGMNLSNKRAAGVTMCFDTDTRIDFQQKDDKPVLHVTLPIKTVLVANHADPVRLEDESAGEFKIMVVSDSEREFASFLAEWRQQGMFSLGVACEKRIIDSRRKIGPQRPVPSQKKVSNGIAVGEDGQSIVGLAVSWSNYTAYYITLSDRNKSATDLRASAADSPMMMEAKINAIRCTLNDLKGKTVIVYDLKPQLSMLSVALGVSFCGGQFCDPIIADWLLGMRSEERTLQTLMAEFCPSLLEFREVQECKSHVSGGSLGAAVNLPVSARIRSGVDAVISRVLFGKLTGALRTRQLHTFYHSVEMPSVLSLIGMELNGFGFASQTARQVEDAIKEQLVIIDGRVQELIGRPLALSSTEAVGQVLFVDLRLPPPNESRQTRTVGAKTKVYYSTSEAILSQIKHLHALPSLVLDYRRLQGALGKSLNPIQRMAVKNDVLHMERVHGECSTQSVTGRISMTDPSLQNVPKDFELEAWTRMGQGPGKSVKYQRMEGTTINISLRSCFVPFQGGILLSADYSQLELRILAHLAQDDKLIAALSSGGDVFKLIASQWKKIDISAVTPGQRQRAKQICYGIIYGIGSQALSEKLNVTPAAAVKFIDAFKRAFPSVPKFVDDTISQCRESGFTETISGCRRYLPNIHSSKGDLRSQAERQAVNSRIQGSAANLAKSAMTRIDAELRQIFPHFLPHRIRRNDQHSEAPHGAYLVLQLHDELIYEVNAGNVARVAEIVHRHMRSAWSLRVPLVVNLKMGPNWGALAPYQLPV